MAEEFILYLAGGREGFNQGSDMIRAALETILVPREG